MRPEDEPADAPQRLVRDLQALHPSTGVPRAVDEAIRASARRTLAARRRRRSLLRALPVTAAAGVVLWLALQLRARPGTLDVDGSGRVDIVDAYVLALRIEEHRGDLGEERRWDFNRDGSLDRLDVERIASTAVRLGS